MNSSIKIDQAVKQYENVLKHRGSGELIIAAFTALSKWLRYESEFKNIETWRKLDTSLVSNEETTIIQS